MKFYGDTNATLSKAIGCSAAQFSAKLNGTRDAEFWQSEIGIIIERYQLSNEDMKKIFFLEDII